MPSGRRGRRGTASQSWAGPWSHPRSNQRCRCRARATCEPGSLVAQGDDAKPGGGLPRTDASLRCKSSRRVERGQGDEGRHRAMGIARRIEASTRRRQLAEQAEQGPQGASPVIGTGGTSGCEASAPQVGHQRPSTQGHPASQWTAKRPESSHTHPKPRACEEPGSGWELGTREQRAVSTWAGWTRLEARVRVPVLAPRRQMHHTRAAKLEWMLGPASHCSGMAG